MKKALIVFAKAPVPGKVKTRLQVDLGADKTVAVYRSFVTDILSKCSRLKGVERFLGCAPTGNNEFLRQSACEFGMERFNQQGMTLGEKIFNAFRYCARKGYQEIVLIGSDSPSMPVSFIRKAFTELSEKDFVIGPCFDQGLYLIGVRKSKIKRIERAVLLDTGKDVSVILKRLAGEHITFSLLPFWYDVDDIEDYRFFELHRQYLNS